MTNEEIQEFVNRLANIDDEKLISLYESGRALKNLFIETRMTQQFLESDPDSKEEELF